jgi:hypothetical protein
MKAAELVEKVSSTKYFTKENNQIISFLPGNTIEAQDFDGKWNSVKVIEVDIEDREVLVRFDKFAKSKATG